MAAFDLKIDVDKATMAAFNKAADDFRRHIGREDEAAMRANTIALCKSLRAATRISKDFIPRTDVRLGNSDPKYITGTHDENRGKLYRRVVITRWSKGRAWDKSKFVLASQKAKFKRNRKGNIGVSALMVDNESVIKQRARMQHGRIYRRGLAKRAWGWMMQKLFGQNDGVKFNGTTAINNLIEGGKMADARMEVKTANGYISGMAVTLVNKLRYARQALKPGGMEEAVKQATKGIIWRLENGVKSSKFAS